MTAVKVPYDGYKLNLLVAIRW